MGIATDVRNVVDRKKDERQHREELGHPRNLLSEIHKGQLGYFRQIVRRDSSSMEKKMMLGYVQGRRKHFEAAGAATQKGTFSMTIIRIIAENYIT